MDRVKIHFKIEYGLDMTSSAQWRRHSKVRVFLGTPWLEIFFFFIYNNLIFFICLPLKKNRNTLQPYQEHPQNFCLHKSSNTSHNFNPCLLQPPVDDQWAMSLTVLVSLLRTLMSFCHLLVENLKSIYLFGKSSFHFLV